MKRSSEEKGKEKENREALRVPLKFRPRKISRFVILGDSLSDRGTLYRRKLWGLIPMKTLSSLDKKSPRGRFTNGFLWGDYLVTTIAERFLLNDERVKDKLEHRPADDADLADEIISGRHNLRKRARDDFNLDRDDHVLYKGHRYARTYCQGGLTSHDYSKEFVFDLTTEGARETVWTLHQMREQLLKDDAKYQVSAKEKEETLVIEWSGANDLFTVNKIPTEEEAEKAVRERIANAEELIRHGYKNLVLFNLPDLSLTPYYSKHPQYREAAHQATLYFNQRLAKEAQKLSDRHQDVYTDVFDVGSLLTEVYENPEDYGFERAKLHTPFVDSAEFKREWGDKKEQALNTCPSEGYMFWDDVHPTADMHSWLADKFEEKYGQRFQFESPAHRMSSDASVEKKEEKRRLDALGVDDLQNTYPDEELLDNLSSDLLHSDPEIDKLIKTIENRATKMRSSQDHTRQDKGHILQGLVANLEKRKTNWEQMQDYLTQFRDDDHTMKIIATHERPWLDRFFQIKTTRSEDELDRLAKLIAVHVPVSKISKNEDLTESSLPRKSE